MLRKLVLAAFVAAAWLPAQAPNVDLTSFSNGGSVADDLKKGLLNPLTGLLASGYAKGVPFTAAAGNFIPNRYHFLIPLVDFYISGPVLIGAGSMDKKFLNDLKADANFGAQIYKALSPYEQYLYAPVPVLAVSMAARIDLPILKMFELQVKFGQVPGQVQDLMKSVFSSLPVGLDIDASTFGLGARVNLINTTLFQLSVGANYDTLTTKANIKYEIKDMVLLQDSNGKLTQDLTFALTNQFQTRVLSANLHASINLAILQIYGGLGLNMDLSEPYKSSFTVAGPLKYVPNSGSPYAAYLPSGQQGSIYQKAEVAIPRADIIPKFAVGVRFLVIDIQGESTFDFSAVAARAGVALSF